MALRPDLVGQRVVVRQVVPGERGPSGGPAFTDVLGRADRVVADELTVRRKDDTVVVVDQALVVTAKPVPPRPSVRHADHRRTTWSASARAAGGRPSRSSWATGCCARPEASPAGPTPCCRSARPGCPSPRRSARSSDFYRRPRPAAAGPGHRRLRRRGCVRRPRAGSTPGPDEATRHRPDRLGGPGAARRSGRSRRAQSTSRCDRAVRTRRGWSRYGRSRGRRPGRRRLPSSPVVERRWGFAQLGDPARGDRPSRGRRRLGRAVRSRGRPRVTVGRGSRMQVVRRRCSTGRLHKAPCRRTCRPCRPTRPHSALYARLRVRDPPPLPLPDASRLTQRRQTTRSSAR